MAHGATPRFPTHLSALHDGALKEAVAFVLQRFSPVGIVAAGSIVRGEGGPTSDLDIYVIHLAPWRQRLQHYFRGVPAELFVNPPAAIRAYFGDEHADARPITAHMLSSGFVVLDDDPVVDVLRHEAAGWLARPCVPSAIAAEYARYLPACHFDDARDVAAKDAATGAMLVASAVRDALRFAFRRDGLTLPRDKDLLAATDRRDPALAAAARRALTATTVESRMTAADEVARRALGVLGFYEWESPRDPVSDEPATPRT
jgi:predicted nucleotidyltransferase